MKRLLGREVLSNRSHVSLVSLSLILLFVSTLVLCLDSEAELPARKLFLSAAESPIIEFTSIPPYGSSENLKGRVRNANPTDYKVAVYIFVEGAGWWTKPYFAQPLTSIQSDSIWTCDITTGGSDIYATRIHAFLLSNGINPPLAGGLACLLTTLDTISVAKIDTNRNPRTIPFSGYEWWVKASVAPVGPGSNYFSDSTENVWVDEQRQLHLKITKRNEIWYCPEVILKEFLGHGRYIFKVASTIGQINENAVLGLFTWDNDGCNEFHREIDIEFSRWGTAAALNAQYVVQPWDRSGNRIRWMIPTSLNFSTHSFVWKPDSISFLSVKGHQSAAPSDSIIHSWLYTGPDVPSRGDENVRINLWLFNGQPPSDNAEVEVVITKFEYYDLSTSVGEQDGVRPTEYSLLQNYPNPFNPSTTIHFELPKSSHVTITIYDVLGREVRTLVDRKFEAGRFAEIWDGRDNRQLSVTSGVYLMRMQAGEFVRVKKLILVR